MELEKIFEDRKAYNDGEWVSHSQKVAIAAQKISKAIGLISKLSYQLGLLHDVGRSFTNGQFLHISQGYNFLDSLGFKTQARICLTHSFPIQNIYSYVGLIDILNDEQEKFQNILKQYTYDDYDLLIQICDAMTTHNGYVMPEQKFVSLVFKYGFNDYTSEKWRKTLEIKSYFEKKIGMDLLEFLNETQ